MSPNTGTCQKSFGCCDHKCHAPHACHLTSSLFHIDASGRQTSGLRGSPCEGNRINIEHPVRARSITNGRRNRLGLIHPSDSPESETSNSLECAQPAIAHDLRGFSRVSEKAMVSSAGEANRVPPLWPRERTRNPKSRAELGLLLPRSLRYARRSPRRR
jgi:hypothetical protein